MKFIIHVKDSIRRENAKAFIDGLDPDLKWEITIKEFKEKRSLEQNAFVHGVQLKLICDHTGYQMDEMKDYLLGEAFGWEEFEFMGQMKSRPIRRSSSLNKNEWVWWQEWIEGWAAQTLGITIPRPNEAI